MNDTSTQKTTVVPDKFEDAIEELESIVQTMEGEVLPLDQAVKAYERGMLLSQACQHKLEAAEQQVKVLQNEGLKPVATLMSDEASTHDDSLNF